MISLTDALALLQNEKREQAEFLRAHIASEYPNTIRALRLVDMEHCQPKRSKGFNLVKRENKKLGYVYYVRYSHNGKMLPTKWNTHTNNKEEAEQFAREHKAGLVERYLRSHDTELFSIFEHFYEPQSAFLVCEEKRNHQLSERCRKEYHAVIKNKLLPFLREQKITHCQGITARTLADFQDKLLSGNVKPQTVNNNLKVVKRILAYLTRKNMICENPGMVVRYIPVHQCDQEARGCYELKKLEGVFNRSWRDNLSYLLCLLIYTTGMRNSEIKRFRMTDIVRINQCRFINIKESKTPSGVRLVPLHDFVYRKLTAYSSGKKQDAPLFDFHNEVFFIRANAELALRLRVDEARLRAEHITFYSGRHFWKTLMNSEGLGEDVEEIFMGHKVSNDVAKRYNHRDKQGKQLMVKKARQVFSILDRHIFTKSKRKA